MVSGSLALLLCCFKVSEHSRAAAPRGDEVLQNGEKFHICMSIRLSVRPPGRPSAPAGWPSDPAGWPSDPSSWPSDPSSWPSDPSSQPSDPSSRPSDPSIRPSGSEGQPAGSEGQPARSEGEPEGGRMDGRVDGWTDEWNFSPSTGLRPLSGPLPCYPLKRLNIKEAGQENR